VDHALRALFRVFPAPLVAATRAGMAAGKFGAWVAAASARPGEHVIVPEAGLARFLGRCPPSVLPVDPLVVQRLERLGIQTLGELRRAPAGPLRPIFGRYVELLQQRAAGIDDRPVIADWEEKQISAEETFDTDIADRGQLHSELTRLADRACTRLRAKELVASCVNVKIRRSDFTTYTRQRHIEPPTQETRVVTAVATELLDAWLAKQPRAALRLLGVGVSELAPSTQLDLFTIATTTRNRELDGAVDRIRDKFGRGSLTRGSVLQRELKPGSK
jgi:DNA polymerase-4